MEKDIPFLYSEPFGGSAAIYHKYDWSEFQDAQFLICDNDEILMEYYECVKNNPEKFTDGISKIQEYYKYGGSNSLFIQQNVEHLIDNEDIPFISKFIFLLNNSIGTEVKFNIDGTISKKNTVAYNARSKNKNDEKNYRKVFNIQKLENELNIYRELLYNKTDFKCQDIYDTLQELQEKKNSGVNVVCYLDPPYICQ